MRCIARYRPAPLRARLCACERALHILCVPWVTFTHGTLVNGEALPGSTCTNSPLTWRPRFTAQEASIKADAFGATHIAVLLSALGKARWDHPAATDALVTRLVSCAREEAVRTERRPEGSPAACGLQELALTIRSLSRLPSARHARQLDELIELTAILLRSDHVEAGGELSPGTASQGHEMSHAEPGSVQPLWLTPRHCRDVATLCNGLRQLEVAPPASITDHLRQVVGRLEHVETGPFAEDLRGQRTRRWWRRVRTKLQDALNAWSR